MSNNQLSRSSVALKYSIISTGIAALLILSGAWLILDVILHWAPRAKGFLVSMSFLVIFFGWAVQSFLSWKNWKNLRYEVDGESIAVYKKKGMFGRTKTVYRYESIISVRMSQGYFGKKHNYGDIYLTIPKLEKEIVLKDIDNPNEPLSHVQKAVSTKSAASQTLVS